MSNESDNQRNSINRRDLLASAALDQEKGTQRP